MLLFLKKDYAMFRENILGELDKKEVKYDKAIDENKSKVLRNR